MAIKKYKDKQEKPIKTAAKKPSSKPHRNRKNK